MGWRRHARRRMSLPTRPWVWRVAVACSGGVGLLCAFVTWGVWGPLATALGLMVPAFTVCVVAEVSRIRRSVTIAWQVGLAIVAAAGLLAAFGWSGAAWLGLLLFTSPFVRILLFTGRLWAAQDPAVAWGPSGRPGDADLAEDDRRWHAHPDQDTGRVHTLTVWLTELPDADGLTALDDGAICAAWRRSYLRLEEATPTSRRLEVVRLRQLYLDELSRRHPAELRRWLASGARAAGNPQPFLERPTGPGQPLAADEPWPDVG